MPIAAVPDYLGGQFTTASPGMRFGMYLKIWGSDWLKVKEKQLDEAKKLNDNDKETLKSLAERQSILAATMPADALLRLEALSTAPFTTGLGNEHPLENGFAFLNPYGLPYLPGSGVKGVLRQAARELASGDWGETHGWTTAPLPSSTDRLSMFDALFGRESKDGDTDHWRGALQFWDVMPQIKGDCLAVDIMTPHQGHYYQNSPAAGSATPHESGQPIPISFLTVPPGSGFSFHVHCDRSHLHRLAAELAANERWKELLTAAFHHAFNWLGFGAKTAVGYGAMTQDPQAAAREQQRRDEQKAEALRQQQAAQHAAKHAAMSPVERSIQEFLDGRTDRNQPEISAVLGAIKQNRWPDEDRKEVAQWLKQAMQQARQWKETTQAKKPEKDKDYQNTRSVLQWLSEP